VELDPELLGAFGILGCATTPPVVAGPVEFGAETFVGGTGALVGGTGAFGTPPAVPFIQAGKVLNSERVQSSVPFGPELKMFVQNGTGALTGLAQLRVPSGNVTGP
jgi:hypothetical protein